MTLPLSLVEQAHQDLEISSDIQAFANVIKLERLEELLNGAGVIRRHLMWRG